jgi:hypothetical protein
MERERMMAYGVKENDGQRERNNNDQGAST